MEAAIANTVTPWRKMLSVIGGKFSEFFMKISQTQVIDSQELAVESGTAVYPKQIVEVLDENKDIKAISVIHNESSTGIAAPIEEIGKVMKNYDSLYIIETVSSLAEDYVDVEKFGIDVSVTRSQKCLAAPPGMAAITLSDYAWKAFDNVETNIYYLDLKQKEKVETKTCLKLLILHPFH